MDDDETPAHIRVGLPAGPVAVSAAYGRPAAASATVAIAHGAGAGYAHPFYLGFARALRAQGFATLRFNFPYVEAGRRMPGPAAHAVLAWTAALRWASEQAPQHDLWAAGKSYGGRMASMAAAEGAIAPAGLIYLGYPLHPPGNPSAPRVAHLAAITAPQLFVEGTRDPFIDPHEQLLDAVASCRDAAVEWIEDATHSFEVKGRRRPADEIGAELVSPVVAWMVSVRSGGAHRTA